MRLKPLDPTIFNITTCKNLSKSQNPPYIPFIIQMKLRKKKKMHTFTALSLLKQMTPHTNMFCRQRDLVISLLKQYPTHPTMILSSYSSSPSPPPTPPSLFFLDAIVYASVHCVSSSVCIRLIPILNQV